MNNLLNWLIILAVIATLVLSIVALVLPCKSGFEDGQQCKTGKFCSNIGCVPYNKGCCNSSTYEYNTHGCCNDSSIYEYSTQGCCAHKHVYYRDKKRCCGEDLVGDKAGTDMYTCVQCNNHVIKNYNKFAVPNSTRKIFSCPFEDPQRNWLVPRGDLNILSCNNSDIFLSGKKISVNDMNEKYPNNGCKFV